MQINTYKLHLEHIPPLLFLGIIDEVVNRGIGSYSSLNSGCNLKELGHVSKDSGIKASDSSVG
jgi:hypothetical protein